MLPLANIVRDAGAAVSGSDRAMDQGRLGPKFQWLQSLGIDLFAQDGSGIISGDQVLIASAAIEDRVPDIAKANALAEQPSVSRGHKLLKAKKGRHHS